MGQDAAHSFNFIRTKRTDYHHLFLYCERMFDMWLERTPQASWKQLIEALKEVQLNQLASELEESLQPAKPNLLESGIVTSEKQWPLKSQELLDLKFKGIIVWNMVVMNALIPSYCKYLTYEANV